MRKSVEGAAKYCVTTVYGRHRPGPAPRRSRPEFAIGSRRGTVWPALLAALAGKTRLGMSCALYQA